LELVWKQQYRTIKGFCNLIEKEWVLPGHQFATRMGQTPRDHPADQVSPTFTFFMDCVHQLWHQHLGEFEFNLEMILDINYLMYTGIFGSSMMNSEIERGGEFKRKTTSLWSYILEHKKKYVNPLYQNIHHSKISVSYFVSNLRFWKELWLSSPL
jgi:hypothetical protein